MKKRTIITTQKHEIWIVREACAEPDIAPDQTIEVEAISSEFHQSELPENADSDKDEAISSSD